MTRTRKSTIAFRAAMIAAAAGGVLFFASSAALADDDDDNGRCDGLPSHAQLEAALAGALAGTLGVNGGLSNDMWATVLNRDGFVCAVAFSGGDRGDQWPGSRVISAQKANTANAFSLPAGAGGLFPGLALSTANLYAAVQPGGGSLFGLQESNPVDTKTAYGGNAKNYGQPNDPMVGKRVGGVNVFGGGLALYPQGGSLVGGIGVSGDTSCTDHVVAWKVRAALGLNNVPAGVAGGTDAMIQPYTVAPGGNFSHPVCLNNPTNANDGGSIVGN